MDKPRLWAVTLAAICLGHCLGDDSLRGALEAINRRQRDLSDSTLYYLEHFRPQQERTMYPRHGEGNGQLEDIGYGYQKSLAPKTSGVFEAVPLPETELGSHSPGVESHNNFEAMDDKTLEDIAENIIQHYKSGEFEAVDPQVYLNHHNPDTKRSVFRERDINEPPNSLQNLSPEDENSRQFYENGERHQHGGPSLFRERYTPKPFRKHSSHKAQALVRNFGGLNRDEDNFPNDDDSDEYLSMLNSVWEKYQDGNPEAVDPEDLSESDVEEIMDYLNHKNERKRQPENSYQTGYDFFSSPLTWVKRDHQRLTDNSKPSSDQFLHALKFLNSHTDTLESMREEDLPDDDRDEDVARLLLEEQAQNNRRYKKRFWRGNTYEEHNRVAKRYPITKRSSSFYTSPAVLYHKASNEKFNQRRKKSHSEESTDPKVAEEINDIFSHSENLTKGKSSDTDKTKVPKNSSNTTSNNTKSSEELIPDHSNASHIKRKRSGQKEETSFESQHKPMESKKAVNWNEYFGIDRRRKKSLSKPSNDEWLLDQYLKAYSISARAIQNGNDQSVENNMENDKKGVDDMDAKLRAMEDIIVDQALKYTGAHEGTTDTEEVQAVKDRVIAQLAAAYSLEKMRKALSEFKSSMAAQKVSPQTTANAPTESPEQKDKRVAVKKEKAGVEKKDSDNEIGVLQSPEHHQQSFAPEESCPIMDDISVRCQEIANMAGDVGQTLAPLCTLHQVCYLCGSEMGTAAGACDLTFLSEANSLCGDSPRCRYTVRRTMAAMRMLRGDPSPLGCDWQHHPCLARYLAITVR
ncbi:uncharacterized protein LOC128990010 [Macrosteles quadrilineatus]|uniref:uncharacterized protein LOC128990010 n=1 Tax=Macrosteles quadrilineatus TaxID=74068 RepID=UPI0023E1157D|nr:uncharacterized protein LOC128990010 [Macrosteles quadrilineatus]